jgi:hypothetical protein
MGWKHAPRFMDVRGAITELAVAAIGHDEWRWDNISGDPVVVVWSEDTRLNVVVSPTGIDIASEQPDTEGVVAVAAMCVAPCLALMNVEEVSEVGGFASWTLAAADADRVESALEGWLFGPSLRTTLGALGGRPDDLILSVRFETDSGVVTILRTEPLTDEQAANGPYFFSDMKSSEFPPASLFARIDRDHRSTFPRAQAAERSQRLLNQVLVQGDKLLATVEGTDDRSADQRT